MTLSFLSGHAACHSDSGALMTLSTPAESAIHISADVVS
jgi:hypothetical protein